MDDMDAQSVEYDGEPSFFVGDYEKYGWRKIFAPGIGGHELLALYGEAITNLNQNPNLPQLFRDVFKNAFLPYRDPETLKLFLKTINEFQYDHSERLGDAFEYLLSVLGSQGDAGQFRTPRHIIDFIVEVVQPRKEETVCDPACGTAGFLISSYKHILRSNTRNTPGDMLTPDDRRRLMQNFVGYDISPDMVRLSLVNLYLHGFPDPHIYEYDTLTSEDRWNESFDVVMANPPFMSPKGGIKPHKKFSLQANRSEVLFVDYIAEHINPVSGRAGVIVPEGIIFQGANAYKDLRKMLVEKALLYAVVSLPAGVFNPYSGVKTSILFFDKTLAAKSDKILFVKIADDGFGLGAQRKQLKTSDLPDALNLILDFQKAIAHGDTSRFENTQELASSAIAVDKSTIAANGDFNLSGDRYRTDQIHISKYEMIELGEVVEVNPKKSELKDLSEDTLVSFVPMACLSENGSDFSPNETKELSEVIGGYTYFKDGDVLLAKVTPCFENGKAGIANNLVNSLGFGSSEFYVLRSSEKILPMWIYLQVKSDRFRKQGILQMTGTGGLQRVPKDFVQNYKIPLPPLSVQKEIVERVEGYQRLIDGAKQVIRNFKPSINLNPDWQMVELGEVCEFTQGVQIPQSEQITKYEDGFARYLYIQDFKGDGKNIFIEDKYPNKKLDENDLVMANTGTPGKVFLGKNGILSNNLFRISFDKAVISHKFLFYFLDSHSFQDHLQTQMKGGIQKHLGHKTIACQKFPLPPLEEQKQIVAEIEREQSLVNANKELITIYEQKIKDEINKLWEQ
jgi:type I restriction enzyme M protein